MACKFWPSEIFPIWKPFFIEVLVTISSRKTLKWFRSPTSKLEAIAFFKLICFAGSPNFLINLLDQTVLTVIKVKGRRLTCTNAVFSRLWGLLLLVVIWEDLQTSFIGWGVVNYWRDWHIRLMSACKVPSIWALTKSLTPNRKHLRVQFHAELLKILWAVSVHDDFKRWF